MAYKVFENGLPLPASDLNDYLMKQSVMVFASSSARASALTAPTEGMLTWLEDSNKYQYWSGSAWTDLLTGSVIWEDKTTNYAIDAADAGGTIRSTGSAITVTIDDVLTQGQRIDFVQAGAGQITFVAGAGVTLNSADAKTKTAKQYAGATVLAGGSGVYYLIGNLG